MSNCVALQTHLASVMESLVHAAIAEMCKLVDEGSVFLLRLELTEEQRADEELKRKMQTESEIRMVSVTLSYPEAQRSHRNLG